MIGSFLVVSATYFLKFVSAKYADDYGVDVTSPIHHPYEKDVDTHFKRIYDNNMEGCFQLYSKRECEDVENTRIAMNVDQPRSQHNYTELGFKKRKLPEHVHKLIKEFYDANKDKRKVEKWSRGYSYVNHWVNPSYMISLEDKSLRGGTDLKQTIWDELQPIIEDWVGHKIEPTSLYGIRVYTDKAILATHVDRLPLVSSCIINVAQEVNEPWPIEVYSHAGKAYNVTMEPGDMVLYESSTVLHGRPFPMNGTAYANIFVHYKPLDHDDMNKLDQLVGKISPSKSGSRPVFPQTNRIRKSEDINDDGRLLRVAASNGDMATIQKLLKYNKYTIINQSDENGWTAVHEAIRSGDVETVKYLMQMGADMSARVNGGGGLLWLAREFFDEDHLIIAYLKEIGVPDNESI
eukprot:gene9289-12516_t